MSHTVICGVDHAPSARTVVEAAAALADGLDARLLLVHASSPRSVPLGRAAPHYGFPGWAPWDDDCEEGPYELLDSLLQYAGTGFVETLVVEGEPARALCALGQSAGADLIVVGSRGMGRFGKLLVGSVSADVARRAACPVVVIPATALGDVERPVVDGATIVCGIGSPDDRRLGEVAASLASALGLRLRLAHVLAPVPEFVVAPAAGAVPAVVDIPSAPRPRDGADLVDGVLADLLADYPELDGRSDWCVLCGDPAAELAELAARSHAAAIVIGTCRRGSLRTALTRSPAAALARAATVPVVICRDSAH